MAKEKLRIVVGGFIGLFPTGGATWDYIQYALGLHKLGHDVYYIEDTMLYPVYQQSGEAWDDCSFGVNYLKEAMEKVGLGDRWAYRDVASGKLFGMSEEAFSEICATADVLMNVSSSLWMRDEYNRIPVKMLVDTDPMFTQYQYHEKLAKGGNEAATATQYMNAHNRFFTFGLNIGKADCRIPAFDFDWHTTVKPIVMDAWNHKSPGQAKYGFTSVMNWTERPDFMFENEEWGQKNKEFKKFHALPSISGEKFEIIINRPKDEGTKQSMHQLEDLGWDILSPDHLIADKEHYKDFVQSSLAEFSITKETYIKSNSGWFSGRSAVYLASGRPVITQDTQWSKYIPSGAGVIAMHDLESATEAVRSVRADYARHSKAATEIAHEYFDSNKVLSDMLSHA
jgi:hypothetical protein